jgi:hypothetical protein
MRAPQEDGTYEEIYAGGKTLYKDTGLADETEYWYKAVASAMIGDKEYAAESEAVSVVTGSAPVQAPVSRPKTSSKPKKTAPDPGDVVWD